MHRFRYTTGLRKGCRAALLLSLLCLAALPATASAATQTLTLEKKGSGTGTVTSSPAGIGCGSTCSAAFNQGEVVALAAVSGPGSGTVKWSGCGSIVEGKCLVTMSIDRTVKATFEAQTAELKVKKGGLGTGTVTSEPAGITCGATCSAKFPEASTVTLTGTPTGESQAPVWSGCDSVNGEGKCLVTISGTREVNATFNVEGPQLTVTKPGTGTGTVTSSPAGLECGSSCAVSFPKGQKVTLKGTPGLHSEAVKWVGCDSVNGKNECVATMSEAREVAATFKLDPQYVEYALTIGLPGTGQGTVTSLPGGIECGAICTASYVFKTQVTLFATPTPGSEFEHWSLNSCGEVPLCAVTLRSARKVNAVFTAVGSRTLAVAKAGTGQGVVTSKPVAIECGSSCSAELGVKTKVSLHAVATPGSTFAGWSGDCSGTKGCRVTMNEVRNVTATFAKTPTPTPTRCHVPRLKGKSLARARKALRRAHCSLGKAKKPKGKGKLIVRSTKPGAGAVRSAGTRVNVKLGRVKKHSR